MFIRCWTRCGSRPSDLLVESLLLDSGEGDYDHQGIGLSSWLHNLSNLPALELSPRHDSLDVLKPIAPLYCISLKVDDSDVHHKSLRCPVITEVAFRTRKPSHRVSFFPSREVHPHVWLYQISGLFFLLGRPL
ncbi:hypothetical protein BHE74_00042656 [Ensete ventricosum]|nr:hypothetical protein GW17_00029769 [Ensete ventricosum]RWW51033.1 hypothetical protein BHE74_00042656 [Ensete ventricosum]